MDKLLITYMPDVRERSLRFQSEVPMEEGLEEIREMVQDKYFCVYSEIVVYTIDKEFVFSIFPYEPYYHLSDNYKYLEPAVKEICNRYF